MERTNGAPDAPLDVPAPAAAKRSLERPQASVCRFAASHEARN